ncbi:MAG: nicotinate-nucleotide adenylyltransferase [Sedimenticola sp.]|nr:nicotinate-nucleotide adenylyltransferase [Sedimenticola sp.]MCW8920498.1 nicotinate-nucleotide adenylyltransferase [Sedimenticola sp.]MDF1529597.1 nicotinate-nucleotide adenylyltransferase [Sedimenticola sp.]
MIGLLGGTFDPIHYGHLRTALDVQQELVLSEMRLIPLSDPPHRTAPSSTPEQRLALLQIAIADEPRLTIDDRELKRGGKSYTVDTLLSLKAEQPDETLCLLLGSDAFNGFHLWHQPEQILELAHLVVMQRPGEPDPLHYHDRLTHLADDLRAKTAGLILPMAVTQLEISATRIRQMIKQGHSPRYLLPDAVLDEITRQKLYHSA